MVKRVCCRGGLNNFKHFRTSFETFIASWNLKGERDPTSEITDVCVCVCERERERRGRQRLDLGLRGGTN